MLELTESVVDETSTDVGPLVVVVEDVSSDLTSVELVSTELVASVVVGVVVVVVVESSLSPASDDRLGLSSDFATGNICSLLDSAGLELSLSTRAIATVLLV